MILEAILVIVLAFFVAALPLHLAIKMLGGKTTILKTILVNVLAGVITAAIYTIFSLGSIIAFIVLIWFYREMFRLRWFKAFLAWIIQITLTFVFILIFGIVLGVSLLV